MTVGRLIVIVLTLLMAGVAYPAGPEATPAFGIVNLSAANFRSAPAHSAELATQASYGTPLKIVGSEGGWLLAELPDGYVAWIDRPAVALMTPEMMTRWRDAPRLIYTALSEGHAVADTVAGPMADNIVTDLVLGSILEGEPPAPGAAFTAVALPDGRDAFVSSASVEPFELWADRRYDPQEILTVAYALTGVPYLWGGTTTKSVDCSGLVKTAFMASGLILPRNASAQALCGIAVDHNSPGLFEPGDLLFFPPEDEPDSPRIAHVAIYDGGTLYVHASGRVRVNSFDPTNRRYLARPVKRAIRAALPGREFQGIVRVADHPMYFCQ